MREWNARILFFILAYALPRGTAAFDNRFSGTRPAALAGAVVAVPGEESLFHNAAGMSATGRAAFILHYESAFLVKELSLMAAGVVLPSPYGTFGAGLCQFGRGNYRETKLGLAYTKQLGPKCIASVQFDYFTLRLPENPEHPAVLTFETGILAGFSQGNVWGIHLFNPAGFAFRTPGGRIPVPWSVRCGNSRVFSSSLLFCSEVEKIAGRPLVVKTGTEYAPHPSVVLRAGVSATPLKFAGGAGFRVGHIRMDIAFVYQGVLGFTPSAGILLTP